MPTPFVRRLAVPLLAAALLAGCDESGPESNATPGVLPPPPSPTVAQLADLHWPAGTVVDETTAEMADNLAAANIVVVLDMSGSMAGTKCAGTYRDKAQAARDVLAGWLANIDPATNLGLVVFDHHGLSTRVPLATGNRRRFTAAVEAALPDGGTPLRDALALGQQMLEAQGARQRGFGDYRLIVITDGAHSEGQDPAPVVRAITDNPASPVSIHTLGFCITDSALNQPGRTFYTSAADPEALRQGLDQVLAEVADVRSGGLFHEQ
ncbi:vWA domain-containing protein [Roseospirillum parvum]|uniref:von Willebrand factor type A domain-containing protein n=1 Tax=Roseospirillum parvum TaxID=83401 RepID=A0A1G7UYP5_9PROT|nr:vWA domain-containing protein [Roseospirillum parvum]SDG52411.1 von Willebrand factor type A domain-containing protein [Roseospirillum parvum]